MAKGLGITSGGKKKDEGEEQPKARAVGTYLLQVEIDQYDLIADKEDATRGQLLTYAALYFLQEYSKGKIKIEWKDRRTPKYPGR